MLPSDREIRVLLVHNFTRGFATGGEAHVFEDEANMLQSKGHEVRKLFVANPGDHELGLIDRIKLFFSSSWSDYGYSLMKKELSEFNPDIVHVHNFFFVFSPKIFLACRENKIPVVTTLHNFRLVVPCSQMLYKGEHCEICLGRNPWRIIPKRCYRNSFFASLFRYKFYYLSQQRHNWWRYINKFIALTENGKEILVKGGMLESKIVIKPNFIEDHGSNDIKNGYGALYIGRITFEKGINHLIKEWQLINYPLQVIGTGDLLAELESTNKNPLITFRGVLSRKEVFSEIEKCAFVIVPSIIAESFGLVNIEAFSMGRPVLASRIGAMKDIIQNEKNGLFIDIQKSGDLNNKVNKLINDPSLLKELSNNARQTFLQKYTSEANYNLLINIYKNVLGRNETD